ncbi:MULTISPECIES: DUF2058 family protein [unclassified Lysobacter]|uniref:DUF2058 domain-containing protein n=1 Tax=unclassified Lysobacter TaxID=2635362 RepID=UPI000701709F|nr:MULTISPECIES: DUF2058 family protein [unclassified Lysobacter]KQZ57689.1 nucleoprotein/polynucleotide-associated enzyme [Lysobacter sp. Root559]KRC33837.1 nucleoprotein/polynucleotide-associated enzyme [Lysobacter sp. Root76]KRD69173.1 nucleoprotein/polynucleotide-associated enzyme [Lysobacter sp. Root96]
MSDTLRDQLLGLGFKPAPKPERPERGNDPKRGGPGRRDGKPAQGARADARGPGGKPAQHRNDPRRGAGAKPAAHKSAQPAQPGQPGQGRPRSREDIDLAKAYAIRAQREKDERIAAEQAKQEEARLRREARAKLAELVKDQTLNVADADIARHFPYGGKIKRIYVTSDQLKALNAGELGVLQMDGRYLLVSAQMLAQAEALFPPAVALKIDPNAPAQDDPYADPQYQVPDDLVW